MSEAEKAGAGKTLRVGVVGVGVMGSNHARVLSELPGVKLVGVADTDRKRCEQVANTLGCASFNDADALMREGVDAVTIAAPTHLHRDIAIDCAARGKVRLRIVHARLGALSLSANVARDRKPDRSQSRRQPEDHQQSGTLSATGRHKHFPECGPHSKAP